MRFLLTIILALVCVLTPAHAFRMSPIELTFSPTGADASRSVTLLNPSDQPVAIELTAHRRDMSADGEDILTPAGDDMIVIPAQVILMPGDRQSVRLQWTGGPLQQERPFRLIAEQLPINLSEDDRDGGRVQLLVRYVASLYVRPDKAAPDVTAKAARIAVADEGPAHLHFEVENAGTAHVALSDLTVQVSDGAGQDLMTLTRDQLDGVTGAVVLPDRTRAFAVALDGQAKSQPVQVKLQYGADG